VLVVIGDAGENGVVIREYFAGNMRCVSNRRRLVSGMVAMAVL